jgi:hypothetical protein
MLKEFSVVRSLHCLQQLNRKVADHIFEPAMGNRQSATAYAILQVILLMSRRATVVGSSISRIRNTSYGW